MKLEKFEVGELVKLVNEASWHNGHLFEVIRSDDRYIYVKTTNNPIGEGWIRLCYVEKYRNPKINGEQCIVF